MEGSRHEKAIITVSAYVIGLVTAFIFFASELPQNKTSIVYSPQTTNVASVVSATTPVVEENISVATNPNEGVLLNYSNGELSIGVNGVVNLLSFNPVLSDISSSVEGMPQGYHYGDLVYKMDKTDSFVFFCEVQNVENENCSGFIYDIKADRIYPVIKDGEPVFISPKSAKQAIWTAVGIKIGSNYSTNANAPWVLIDADSKLDLE